ncbi:M23 family metallopeptidase [Pontibacter sp. G13]|uniref:M23 family metallopeptidase n=1 Tax=Pontibacter sp. G13 TaxID=3074898 RepID=UPI00288BB02C|nr:M23 family metallopeptidase [Pontibacter sp. G13]WNJ18454.1 M23 family metallopeptidase [Pontibacter sp. G13]
MPAFIRKKRFLLPVGSLVILLFGFLFSAEIINPVKGASQADYHPESFWYYPWGKSVVHKGVDIFGKKGKPVLAATGGWIVFARELGMGGNVLIVLGPHWQLHYYAHLDEFKVARFDWVSQGEEIGTVGNSGNAFGKAPHLHYTIWSMIPYPWLMDEAPQGWKKCYILDPVKRLNRLYD